MAEESGRIQLAVSPWQFSEWCDPLRGRFRGKILDSTEIYGSLIWTAEVSKYAKEWQNTKGVMSAVFVSFVSLAVGKD